MDALIYDRAEIDVINRTDKGFWQVSDLTRITEWITYLGTLFSVVVNATVHVAGDLVAFDDVLADIGAIRVGHTFPAATRFTATPTTPTKTAWTYIKANAVERILFDADLWETAREKLYKYCGTFSAGTDFQL